MDIFKKLVVNIFIVGFLTSCNGQQKEIRQCDSSYKNAKFMIGKYGESSDKYFLLKALQSLDTSLKCETTKAESINLKITVYSLLEDYEGGLSFVDSLKTTDFSKPYERKMYSNIFRASKLSFKGDSIGSRIVYSQIASDIHLFLKNSKSDIFDKEALSSLFFVESKYLTKSEISKQLDTLKIKFPNDSNFIDMLMKQYVYSYP